MHVRNVHMFRSPSLSREMLSSKCSNTDGCTYCKRECRISNREVEVSRLAAAVVALSCETTMASTDGAIQVTLGKKNHQTRRAGTEIWKGGKECMCRVGGSVGVEDEPGEKKLRCVPGG